MDDRGLMDRVQVSQECTNFPKNMSPTCSRVISTMKDWHSGIIIKIALIIVNVITGDEA